MAACFLPPQAKAKVAIADLFPFFPYAPTKFVIHAITDIPWIIVRTLELPSLSRTAKRNSSLKGSHPITMLPGNPGTAKVYYRDIRSLTLFINFRYRPTTTGINTPCPQFFMNTSGSLVFPILTIFSLKISTSIAECLVFVSVLIEFKASLACLAEKFSQFAFFLGNSSNQCSRSVIGLAPPKATPVGPLLQNKLPLGSTNHQFPSYYSIKEACCLQFGTGDPPSVFIPLRRLIGEKPSTCFLLSICLKILVL